MTQSDGDQYLLRLPKQTQSLAYKGPNRDREAARLKALGWSLDGIAEQLGLYHNGAPDPTRAAAAIKRAMANVVRFANDEMRITELQSLDLLEFTAWQTLKNQHVMVSHGQIVRDDTGEALDDDRFVLEVIDRIIKVKERRAKMLGLDAPSRAEVVTIDSIEDEIRRLESEIRKNTGEASYYEPGPELESGPE